MSLLGNLFQLLKDTVSTVNLSVARHGGVPSGEVLLSWTPPLGGVYRLELHMYNVPSQGVSIRVGGEAVFTPASSATPGASPYSIQVTTLAGQIVDMVTTMQIDAVFADLIIAQIG